MLLRHILHNFVEILSFRSMQVHTSCHLIQHTSLSDLKMLQNAVECTMDRVEF